MDGGGYILVGGGWVLVDIFWLVVGDDGYNLAGKK